MPNKRVSAVEDVFRPSGSGAALRPLAFAVALGALAYQPPAHAQPTPTQATQAQRARAVDHYDAGLEAYTAGEYERALPAFRASQAAVASPHTQLMIGRCLLALQRLAAAYRALSAAVALAERLDDPRYVAGVASARLEMDRLRPKLAVLVLGIDDGGKGARLRINAVPVPRAGWREAFVRDPGAQVVELSFPDGKVLRRRLRAKPGERLAVRWSVAPSLASVAAAAPSTSAPGPDEEGGLEPWAVAGWTTAGVGLLGVAGFALLGGLSSARLDELESACPARTDCDPALRQTARDGQRLEDLANLSLAAGAALVVAGAALVVWTHGDDTEETVVELGGGTLRVRGRL